MYRDLERRGEFEARFNSFSEFIQCMIEDFHENPERVEAEYHKQKAELHKERAEKLEEELNVKQEAEQTQVQDQEWLKNKVNWLYRKGRSNGGVKAAFDEREKNLVQKYSREFDSINPRSLRKRMEQVAKEEGYDVDLTA